MQKKQKEKRKGSVVPSVLLGSMVSLLLSGLVILGLALFVLRGGSVNGLILGASLGVCVLIGGRVAIREGSGPVFLTGVLTAVAVCALLFLLRYGIGNTWTMAPSFLSTLLLVLAGGGLAGLFGRRKRK